MSLRTRSVSDFSQPRFPHPRSWLFRLLWFTWASFRLVLQFINNGAPRAQLVRHLEQQEVGAETTKNGKHALASPQDGGSRTRLGRGLLPVGRFEFNQRQRFHRSELPGMRTGRIGLAREQDSLQL